MNNIRKNNYLILGVIICIFFLAIDIFVISNPYMQSYTEDLNNVWLLSRNNQDNYTTTYNINNIKKVKPNEVIYIKKTLDTKIINPILIIRTNLHSVSVQIDNDIIYTSDQDHKRNPGKALHIVPLKDEYKGRSLIISESSPFSFYAGNMGSIFLATSQSVPVKLVIMSFFDILLGLVLIVLGISQLCIVLFPRFNKKNLENGIIYFSFISILIGIIFAINCPLSNLLFNPTVISNVQLTCLYILPTMYVYLLKKSTKYKSISIKYALITNTVFGFITIICAITHVIQLPSLIYLFIIISTLNVLLVIYIQKSTLSNTDNSKISRRHTGSLILFVFTYIIHILYLLNGKYNIINKHVGIYKFIIAYSILYYAIVNYLAICTKIYNVNSILRNNSSLKSIAFSDKLTKLKNRYAFETDLENISNREIENGKTAVFVFDLNRLKHLNDKYGHSSGDKYIQLCALCISETFKSSNLIYRIGGDEFVVILHNTCFSDVNLLMDNLYNTFNSTQFLGKPLSVAYGYALYDSFLDNGSLKNTFNRADKKMYACKTKQKEQ